MQFLIDLFLFIMVWASLSLISFCFCFNFQYNFVGRILGPRGMTAKQLEQETKCKIMVRGKGSMRDKKRVSYLNIFIVIIDKKRVSYLQFFW